MSGKQHSPQQPKGSSRSGIFERSLPGYTDTAIVRHFLDLPHTLGWQTGAFLTLVRFKFVGSELQVMVKASKGGEHRVAFLNCRTWADAVELLSFGILKDKLVWRVDKLPPTN